SFARGDDRRPEGRRSGTGHAASRIGSAGSSLASGSADSGTPAFGSPASASGAIRPATAALRAAAPTPPRAVYPRAGNRSQLGTHPSAFGLPFAPSRQSRRMVLSVLPFSVALLSATLAPATSS